MGRVYVECVEHVYTAVAVSSRIAAMAVDCLVTAQYGRTATGAVLSLTSYYKGEVDSVTSIISRSRDQTQRKRTHRRLWFYPPLDCDCRLGDLRGSASKLGVTPCRSRCIFPPKPNPSCSKPRILSMSTGIRCLDRSRFASLQYVPGMSCFYIRSSLRISSHETNLASFVDACHMY